MAKLEAWEDEIRTFENPDLGKMNEALKTLTEGWPFFAREFEGVKSVARMVEVETERRIREHVKALQMKTLNDIDGMYRRGDLSREVTQAYIDEWNKGPHFGRASILGGQIVTRYDGQED